MIQGWGGGAYPLPGHKVADIPQICASLTITEHGMQGQQIDELLCLLLQINVYRI